MIDSEQQARIWQRVRQQAPESGIPEQTLCLWLSEAMGRKNGFARMARQAPRQAQTLRRLAELENESIQILCALRQLYYGRRGGILPAASEGAARREVGLRRCYDACAAAEEHFRAAAGRWPRQADALRRLAALKSRQCAILERMV